MKMKRDASNSWKKKSVLALLCAFVLMLLATLFLVPRVPEGPATTTPSPTTIAPPTTLAPTTTTPTTSAPPTTATPAAVPKVVATDWSPAEVDIDGGGRVEWILEPNLWNVSSKSGEVTMTFDTGSCDLNVEINLSGIVQKNPSSWVHAYPEIWYGAKPWNTLGPADDGPFELPEKLSELNDFLVTVTYSVDRPDPDLPFNLCFETWLTRSASRGSVGSDDVEIMVWLTYSGLQGAGSLADTVTINGVAYQVWREDSMGGGWEYFAFLPTAPKDQGTITIRWGPFIREAHELSSRRGWENLYFTSIELGTEFGTPGYSSARLSWSLSNYSPDAAFEVLEQRILEQ